MFCAFRELFSVEECISSRSSVQSPLLFSVKITYVMNIFLSHLFLQQLIMSFEFCVLCLFFSTLIVCSLPFSHSILVYVNKLVKAEAEGFLESICTLTLDGGWNQVQRENSVGLFWQFKGSEIFSFSDFHLQFWDLQISNFMRC